ncbi:hypothetical protein RA28_22010 [Ruegeria sp. ANG-S4]|uniref:hypothetical protein n=1 Tax=Ruegeria sp. ANG-S4 TaxID=1577904 RepID=UPI00057F4F26|nr:hypothetical protein [Ruegeria sp. ANG-S4]KIC40379.1 hypothetical protein RA28_22010 [Ruegeria sp. ANG-S4]
MPNIIAYIVLFGWPLVVVILFRLRPAHEAFILSILGGMLILPSGVSLKIPMLPAFDKSSIPSLSVLAAALLVHRHKTPTKIDDRENPSNGFSSLYSALIFLALFSPILTVLTNDDPIIFGPRYIPGLRIYDALSVIAPLFISFIPLFLGKRFLTTPESHVFLLKTLCISGLLYSVPMLFEARFSPQLHTWIYGFFPHSFEQHVRAGGFRPVVFFRHGLLLGLFIALTVIAAIFLWRKTKDSRWFFAACWLSFILLVSKSLGPLALALLFFPIAMLATVRVQLVCAAIVAAIILVYPAMRGAGLVPVNGIYQLASSIDENRAGSLKFRLDNEDLLLERANERPVFGWGTWGRPEIFDPVTGAGISVFDGAWIIIIGVYGWVGYIAQFGLLTLPLFFLFTKRKSPTLTLATSALSLLLAINLIDLIPNASLTPLLFLMSGALLGIDTRGASKTHTLESKGKPPEIYIPMRKRRRR